MTTIEHKEIKGITVKNLVVSVFSMVSIVVSVMTTYFQLKGDIRDMQLKQDAQVRINEIRLKVLEEQVVVLQQEVADLEKHQNIKP